MLGDEEIMLKVRSTVNKAKDDFALTLRLVFSIYAALAEKHFDVTKAFDTQEIIDELAKSTDSGNWELSDINLTNFTMLRRGGSIFFSSNKNLKFENQYLRHVASVFSVFSDVATLKTFRAIYTLTERDEEKYVFAEDIAKESGLSIEKTESILENQIYEYLREKGSNLWGIKGCYMHLIPLMAMFGEHD